MNSEKLDNIMRDPKMEPLNTPIYFKLTRIVALTDVVSSVRKLTRNFLLVLKKYRF